MSEEDSRRTIHYTVGRLGDRCTGGDIGGGYAARPTSEDPDRRQTYAFAVATGWAVLLMAGVLATGAAGFLAESAFGDSARRVAAGLFGGATMFCAAGVVNAAWRGVWFTPKARRRARASGSGSAEFQRALRRIPPRASSLIWQSVVGIVTFVIVIT